MDPYKLRVGDIYFQRTDGPMGKLIRGFTGGEFNHCGIVGKIGIIPEGLDKGCDGIYIYEALYQGFVGSWYPTYWLEHQLELNNIYFKRPNQKLKNVKENCDKYLGKRYGFIDLGLIVLAKILPFLRKTDTVNSIICSEAVARVLYDSSKSINFQEEYNTSYSLITPFDIFYSNYMVEIK